MQVDLVQITTRDGVRLDGMLQMPAAQPAWPIAGVCCVHGTGGNFYASSMFDALAARCLERGCAVLRVNTRGHDGISNAVTARGGRRLGAAYETVDDCRHDLAAWIEFLNSRVGPRVGLVGHSLGAVKSLYALAHETLDADCVVAISPPRLSYAWFCASPEGAHFLETFSEADALVQSGRPGTLMEVQLPLPMPITAAGFVEKYGPDERYNFLKLLHAVRCPTLITYGEIELGNNMAFRAASEAIAEQKRGNITVSTIPRADHFYSAARAELLDCIDQWLLARKENTA